MKEDGHRRTDEVVGPLIEDLLTGASSLKLLRTFDRRWLRIELGHRDAGRDQIRRDLLRAEKWKAMVMQSLGTGPGDRGEVADRWAGVIRLRVEVLESWSQFFGAISAYLAGGAALLALTQGASDAWRTAFVVLGIVVGLVGGLTKYCIDRHKASNKFVLACLEAASKVARPGQAP